MAIVSGLEEQQDEATLARSRFEAEEQRVRDSLADRLAELEDGVKEREEQAHRCKLEAESTMLTALETRRKAARAEREGNALKDKYTKLIKDNITLLQKANASARAAQVVASGDPLALLGGDPASMPRSKLIQAAAAGQDAARQLINKCNLLQSRLNVAASAEKERQAATHKLKTVKAHSEKLSVALDKSKSELRRATRKLRLHQARASSLGIHVDDSDPESESKPSARPVSGRSKRSAPISSTDQARARRQRRAASSSSSSAASIAPHRHSHPPRLPETMQPPPQAVKTSSRPAVAAGSGVVTTEDAAGAGVVTTVVATGDSESSGESGDEEYIARAAVVRPSLQAAFEAATQPPMSTVREENAGPIEIVERQPISTQMDHVMGELLASQLEADLETSHSTDIHPGAQRPEASERDGEAEASQQSRAAEASQQSRAAEASQQSRAAEASQQSRAAEASQQSRAAEASQQSRAAEASQQSRAAEASQQSRAAEASQHAFVYSLQEDDDFEILDDLEDFPAAPEPVTVPTKRGRQQTVSTEAQAAKSSARVQSETTRPVQRATAETKRARLAVASAAAAAVGNHMPPPAARTAAGHQSRSQWVHDASALTGSLPDDAEQLSITETHRHRQARHATASASSSVPARSRQKAFGLSSTSSGSSRASKQGLLTAHLGVGLGKVQNTSADAAAESAKRRADDEAAAIEELAPIELADVTDAPLLSTDPGRDELVASEQDTEALRALAGLTRKRRQQHLQLQGRMVRATDGTGAPVYLRRGTMIGSRTAISGGARMVAAFTGRAPARVQSSLDGFGAGRQQHQPVPMSRSSGNSTKPRSGKRHLSTTSASGRLRL